MISPFERVPVTRSLIIPSGRLSDDPRNTINTRLFRLGSQVRRGWERRKLSLKVKKIVCMRVRVKPPLRACDPNRNYMKLSVATTWS